MIVHEKYLRPAHLRTSQCHQPNLTGNEEGVPTRPAAEDNRDNMPSIGFEEFDVKNTESISMDEFLRPVVPVACSNSRARLSQSTKPVATSTCSVRSTTKSVIKRILSNVQEASRRKRG